MRHLRTQNARRHRRGVAATELALVLPALAAFTLTTIDFGRISNHAISLDNAVRVGAEYGASRSVSDYTQQAWEDEVRERVEEELTDVAADGLTNLQISVSLTSSANNLHRVTVSAEATFSTIVNWSFLAKDVEIRREITVQQFR